jgi:hypothetical protein
MKKHILLFTIILGLIAFSCSKSDDDQESEYQGLWSGTFAGDANGTWSALIDSDGIITGTAQFNGVGLTLQLNGSVSPSGVFQATAGTASNGAEFSGQLTETSGSGIWINTALAMDGTWTGTRQ